VGSENQTTKQGEEGKRDATDEHWSKKKKSENREQKLKKREKSGYCFQFA